MMHATHRSPPRAQPPPRAARVLLALLVASVVLLEFPGAREYLASPTDGLALRGLVVQRVRPDGPNATADIRPGDEIVAIDHHPLRNIMHYRAQLARTPMDTVRVYTLRRRGTLLEVPVRYERVPLPLLRRHQAALLVGLCFLLLGVWVYSRRPDTVGLLFALLSSMIAFLLTDRPTPRVPAGWLAMEILVDAVTLFFPPVLVHFFLRFPPPRRGARPGSRRRRLALYAPPAVLLAAGAALAGWRFGLGEPPPALLEGVVAASTLGFVGYLLAGVVVFVRRLRSSDPVRREKLRVVAIGTAVGFTPLAVCTLVQNLAPRSPLADVRLETAAVLALALVPASFAYAILKYNAIEIEAVLRRSIVYAFLTGALVAGYYIAVRGLSRVFVPALGVSEYVFEPLSVLGLAVLFAPARERLQRVVDRAFFRSTARFEDVVRDLGAQLSRRIDVGAILDAVLDRFDAVFSPAWTAVYRREGDVCARCALRGRPEREPPASLPVDTALGRYLERHRRPLMIEYLDPAWATHRLDATSARILAREDLGACVPLPLPDGLWGLLLVGTRRAGVPYRLADARLMAALAQTTALALRNADLIAASLERERLKNEVLLARDIQLSLLPSRPASVEGTAVAGRMESCHEVGGDYWDAFDPGDGRLAVCVGDVSGKGVPAAMLMASLRAVFREAARRPGATPGAVNAALDDFMRHSARPGQFATFFYGILDPASWRLTYSNAGHCPPLLLRRGFVDRLCEGGTVLGAAPDGEWIDGAVALEPGDRVVLYTDGVTEQPGPDGERFGETRLVEILRRGRNLPVEQLLETLFDALGAWSPGERDDDVTVVILGRNGP